MTTRRTTAVDHEPCVPALCLCVPALCVAVALSLAASLVRLARRQTGCVESGEVTPAWLQSQQARGGLLHRKLSHLRQSLAFLPERFALCDLNHDAPGGEQTANLSCPLTRTSPHFPICLYPPSVDKYISGAILSSGVWEPYITKVYQIALSKHPTAVVIDVGANIGYYSFLAARMGHTVIALEPVSQNVRRLQRGARLGRVADSIYLLQNALADRHGTASLSSNPDNQGGIKVLAVDDGQAGPGGREQARTLTMDDLLLLMPLSKAIIKIDVEGFECRAMLSSRQLFARVAVPYIFMEWQQMFAQRWLPGSPCPRSAMVQLAAMLTDRGYIPHEVRTGIQLNAQRCAQTWRLGDVYWRHRSQPTLIPPL